MRDQSKTKQALIQELASLRQRITELEQSELELNRVEKQIRESEENYRSLFDNLNSAAVVVEPILDGNGRLIDLRYLMTNSAVEKQVGKTRDELVGKLYSEAFSYPERNPVFDIYETVLSSNEPFKGERYLPAVNRYFDLAVNRTIAGNLALVMSDITDRKQAEEALRKSEERYRMAQAIGHVGSWEYNLRTAQFWGSDEAKRIYGFNLEDLDFSTDEVENCITERERVHKALVDFIEADKPYNLEFEIHPKNSLNPRIISSVAELKRDEHGNPLLVTGFIQDITDLKQAAEALHESEERFRVMSDGIPQMIWVTNAEGLMEFVNRAYGVFFGVTLHQVQSEGWQPLVHPDDRDAYAAEYFSCLRAHKPFHAEVRVRRHDGEWRWVESYGQPRFSSTGEFMGIAGSSPDITERKQSEEIIKASLQEKDILLREIHHRVKNNLQVISGLLDLQAMSVGNPELMERLNESQSRIQAMAMVHEKLYSSKDFSRIDLADYVRTLSKDLFKSYKINPGKIDLIIQTDGVVYVDINKAIPCGLILNELISNALKHAFPGDRHGELQVLMGETKNAEIEIIIRDNGLGLPDDVDIHQPQTLGLDLVNGLIKNQLDGQIEVRRDNGTEFRIKFPL